ncbi:hypothetical protein RM844_27875 [Streptomyces sp. DSM 44915]|uniref:Integral membrane protein n=1 Tax=Streptomyces chisholmiae TaxID=3075540 RepID=A0ABU2K0X0_9ACTN|nr:hypothetical protein [Streptomyces sp. DSM 44915]MDT0270098.1 hypothetical protein [Streptomyces sp. DSM 44915]
MVQREARNPTYSAREHALAVLRVRNTALALALAPAALAVVLLVVGAPAPVGWAAAGVAAVVLAVAGALAALIASSRQEPTPAVPLPEPAAPALHRLIRELADQLDVPPPGGIALTPDCDSWLEEPRRPVAGQPPTLVIGSPFLWWLRVGELRALLAPVVAGTGPAAHPDVASARRCLRAWDAAAGRAEGARAAARPLVAAAGWLARRLLRSAAWHSAELERGVAAASAARARGVDQGLRTLAQEQVGLAYAGWDRLLTRVALPAWRTGRWPSGLDAGVAAALTELSGRDRLADGFSARLGQRPACDLLERPGEVDRQVSLLAAQLFHGQPADATAAWAPVEWPAYPDEVVDRVWRDRAARLFTALDAAETPTLARVLHGLAEAAEADGGTDALAARLAAEAARAEAAHAPRPWVPADGRPGPLPFPPGPPRGRRETLIDHVAAAVCCAAADTAGASPGLDWLDGPVLRTAAGRPQELSTTVHRLVEEGDQGPLRDWLATAGVRSDKPVRLV